MKQEELEAQIEALKAELNEALKAAATPAVDVEGLKKNRDALLKEKKSVQEELEKLKAEKKANEARALEEQSKYKELWESEKADHEKTRNQFLEASRRGNLIQEATRAGMDIKYLPMLDNVEYAEDGSIKDPDALFSKTKEAFPLFFGDQNPVIPDSDGSKPSILSGSRQKFKVSDFNNHEFYSKNKDAMDAAWDAGEVAQ